VYCSGGRGIYHKTGQARVEAIAKVLGFKTPEEYIAKMEETLK
jgi:hypothetical protein